MRLQAWPSAAKIVSQQFAIEAHSRGAVLPSGIEGFERAPGARFTGQISVAPLSLANAFAFRAFLHSLRGRGGSFLLPLGSWLEATRTGGAAETSTLAAAGSAGSETLSITLSSGVTLAAGRMIYVGNPATTGQLFRVIDATVGATIVVTVRPRVRITLASGATVRWANTTAPVRLTGSTPAVPITIGQRSMPVSLDIEEAY
jgi:hypothetical protein